MSIPDFIANSSNSESPSFSLSVRDILRDDPVLAREYLSKYVYWMNGVITYMSYVCGASQASLASLFSYNGLKISQPGVGKRVNRSIDKLRVSLSKPNFPPYKIRFLLESHLDSKSINYLIVYWSYSTFVITSWVTGDSFANGVIHNAFLKLKSVKYPSEDLKSFIQHLEYLLSYSTYGDTQFKPFYQLRPSS